jgi:hypothetical protein
MLMFACLGIMRAQESLPPKPAQLLYDDARLFTEEEAARMSALLTGCEERTGVRIYLAAFTLLHRPTIHQQAKEMVKPWLGQENALLLAFHRGTKQSVVVLSPEMWRRYPSLDLVTTFDLLAADLSAKDQSDAGQRMFKAVETAVSAFTKLEDERQVRCRTFTKTELIAAAIFGALLAVLALVAWILNRNLKRRETARNVHYEFPQVEVAMRLGAPLGGGVIVEGSAGN